MKIYSFFLYVLDLSLVLPGVVRYMPIKPGLLSTITIFAIFIYHIFLIMLILYLYLIFVWLSFARIPCKATLSQLYAVQCINFTPLLHALRT